MRIGGWKGENAEHGKCNAPPAVGRGRQRLLPPSIDPSTPRSTWRPSSEPMLRAALFVMASKIPCDCRPPRGPVLPNTMSETGLLLCSGCVGLGSVRAFSFSYAVRDQGFS